MTAYQIGYWIGTGLMLSLIIWFIWAIIKYKPFTVFVKVLYDIRYFVVQVILMYSNKPSIFSIKRFHNGLITYWAIITASLFIRHKKETLSAAELMLIIGPLLILGGYNIYQTQKEKKMNIDGDLSDKVIDNATDVANKIVEK